MPAVQHPVRKGFSRLPWGLDRYCCSQRRQTCEDIGTQNISGVERAWIKQTKQKVKWKHVGCWLVALFIALCLMCSGDSANAVPPTKKLRTRVTNICGDRRGQPNRSAMERPHSGPTAVVIAVQPVPGKYDWNRRFVGESPRSYKKKAASNMYVPILSVQKRKMHTDRVRLHPHHYSSSPS